MDRYTVKEFRPLDALPEFDIRNEHGFVARGINGPEVYKLKDLANRAEKLEAALRKLYNEYYALRQDDEFYCIAEDLGALLEPEPTGRETLS